jgi:hypothetical protein
MRPTSFVPMVGSISPEDAGEIPGLEAAVSYWTGGVHSAEEWFREIEDSWGTAGFVVRRGGEVQGFVLYGPPGRLARAARYPVGPLDEEAVLLAYVGGDARTRRRLLVRMLRDVRGRGVGRVEAISSDRGAPNHVSTSFLLESGWRPVRRAFYGRGYYTLARIDLKSAVEVGELARALVGRVKLPGLKTRVPMPGVLARAAGERGER